jgi:hypothetical protein
MRSRVMLLEALGGVRPFPYIMQMIETGTPGLDIEYGQGLSEFLAEHPENATTIRSHPESEGSHPAGNEFP